MKITTISIATTLILLISGCVPGDYISLDPVFTDDNIDENVYLIDTSDYNIQVSMANAPTSVTCYIGDSNPLTMANTGAFVWEGMALYGTHMTVAPSVSTVNCIATSLLGDETRRLGTITQVENQPPIIIMLSGVEVCGNDGELPVSEPLVDESLSTYLVGATFTLTQGTLPDSGLTIDANTGYLTGTTTISGAGGANDSATNLQMTATTLVGSDQSAVFSFDIRASVCNE